MRAVKAALALGALAALLVPASALGGGGNFVIVSIGTVSGARPVRTVESTIEVSGKVTVDFHGDAAAGCAAAHLCDVNGTVRWNPSGSGSVTALTYRQGGNRFEEGFTALGFADSDQGRLRTSARVRRDGVPGSLCADAAEPQFATALSPPRRDRSVVVRLIDLPSRADAPGQVLQTRCAGPLTADLAGLLPAHRLTERALVRGNRTLDFSADRSFASHGLAGTLHSTVAVRVLGAVEVPAGIPSLPTPRARRHRVREVDVTYRVERVSGSVVTSVNGRSDPDLCGPLDSCRIVGSVSVDPSASSGSAFLTASASARRSGRELRAALGLVRRPRRRGISAGGQAAWHRDLGSVTADLTREGMPACSDSMPIRGGGTLNLGIGRGRVRAAYLAGSLFSETDLLRTRCPGPTSDDTGGALARGTFPLRVLRHRRVTLHLTRGRGFRSLGYSGRSRPDVTIVLRRTRVHEFTYSEEIPGDFGNSVRSLR